jgi:hypothetical protein
LLNCRTVCRRAALLSCFALLWSLALLRCGTLLCPVSDGICIRGISADRLTTVPTLAQCGTRSSGCARSGKPPERLAAAAFLQALTSFWR